MPTVEITILGQKYTLKGDAPAKSIEAMAEDIEDRLLAATRKYPGIATNKAMVLVLLNMAEELHQLKTDQQNLTSDLRAKAEILTGLFD